MRETTEKEDEMSDKEITLGDIAEVLEGWREQGVTRASVLYVLDRVFWEET